MTTISGPNSYDALTVENTSTDFSGVRIRMRDGNSTANQYSYWYMNSDVVYFHANNNNVAWQSTADGVVSKPNQCSFSAYMSQANPTITGNPTKIPYQSTRWDTNSDFDTTNHRFVAPVEGKYLFQINHNAYSITSGNYLRTQLYVNGALYSILGYIRTGDTGDHTVNDSVMVSLSQNDYVEVYSSSNDGSYSLSATTAWNSFSGILVG